MTGTHVHLAAGQTDCTGQGTTWGPGIGPPPAGCDGGGAGTTTTTTTCDTSPCMASHLGQIAATTVAAGGHAVGTAVYGPFENGFAAQQDNILAGLGCATGQGYVAGGIDTSTAEQMVGADCGVALPRAGGDGAFISLLDACGHHADHFHEHFGCLWQGLQDAATGHSARIAAVGGVADQHIYGKFEDENAGVYAQVDACGGHFGVTPDSNGAVVYHYHVQDAPPFTLGCIGPAADGGLVTVDACRALDTGCGDGDTATLTTAAGDVEYDLWCPCYDGNGSNVGTTPRPVFDTGYTGTGSVTGPWTDANEVRDVNSADYVFEGGTGESADASTPSTAMAIIVITAAVIGLAIAVIAAVLWKRSRSRASPAVPSV